MLVVDKVRTNTGVDVHLYIVVEKKSKGYIIIGSFSPNKP